MLEIRQLFVHVKGIAKERSAEPKMAERTFIIFTPVNASHVDACELAKICTTSTAI